MNDRTIQIKKALKENKLNCDGIIYLLAGNCDRDYDWVKIGVTQNLNFQRINQISPKLPFEPSLISCHQSFGGFVYKNESLLHKTFEQYRANGEWFKFPKSCISRLPILVELILGLDDESLVMLLDPLEIFDELIEQYEIEFRFSDLCLYARNEFKNYWNRRQI